MTSQSDDTTFTSRLPEDFIILSRRILQLANLGPSRIEFLRAVSTLLMKFAECDFLELQLFGDIRYQWQVIDRQEESISFELIDDVGEVGTSSASGDRFLQGLAQLARRNLPERLDPSAACFTEYGSFWSGDIAKTLDAHSCLNDDALSIRPGTRSLALIPFAITIRNVGLLRLECMRRGVFTYKTIGYYEGVAKTLGMAAADRRAQAALRERVKELTCLYGIARATKEVDRSLDTGLQQITALLPPAWQYPDIATARIVVDGVVYVAADFSAVLFSQSANIVIGGVPRGTVEVGYVDEKPEFVEGVFLKEEDDLLDAVAREVSLFIEQNEAARQCEQLSEQLRHADRLTTIGQLSAGVAHEINEPLGGILGCAQLARKAPELSQETATDLDDIIAASLHAREIVKKLMLFARQTPSRKARADLNQVVEQGLSFLGGRCAEQGVDLVRNLAPDLPLPFADFSQLQQVLVNLVVNALQAMPDGGTLTVATGCDDSAVALVVDDTGAGMSEETRKKIFDPFFTTKDVGEGNGLGLSVVHGIVTSHGGTITCESKLGRGTRFEIQFPCSGSADSDDLQDSENE